MPEKDAKLAIKLLNNRDFNSILELVKSDIYKEERKSIDEPSSYLDGLEELRVELISYMSYLDIPDEEYNNYDFYD